MSIIKFFTSIIKSIAKKSKLIYTDEAYKTAQVALFLGMCLSFVLGWLKIIDKALAILIFSALFLYYFTRLIGLMFLFVGVLIVLLLIYKYQGNLLYAPIIPNCSKSPSKNPVSLRQPGILGQDYQILEIVTEDGIKIRGWIIKHQRPKQIIIYFHENAGNIGYRIPFVNALKKNTQSTVILVAYRGYSDSQGTPSEDGLCHDGTAIINKAQQYRNLKHPSLGIFVFGRSLGGAVAIHCCSKIGEHKVIKGVILENTFTSISDMIDAVLPIIKPVKFLQTSYWKSIQKIPKINIPILFIKSLKDELVPPSHMDNLIKNAKKSPYIQLHQIPQGTHNNSWQINFKQYFNVFNKFLYNCNKQNDHS